MAIKLRNKSGRFMFLRTALLHNVSYPSLKFQVDCFCNLEIMARTRSQSVNLQRAITKTRGPKLP